MGEHTIAMLWREATHAFDAAGIDTARLDARLLLGHVTGLSATELLAQSERAVSPGQAEAFRSLVDRRARREPVSRILGQREFWGLEFAITPDVLDPRPDTETVVDSALALARSCAGRSIRVLDVGTGSGCILLAILSSLGAATGVGTDVSAAAVDVASANARRLGFADRASFVVTPWADGVEGLFDLVVSNPPYLSQADMAARDPEVMFDPDLALDGGADGLAAYRDLLPSVARVLAPGGVVVVEVGAKQAAAVCGMLAAAGYRDVTVKADLAGRPRCVAAGSPR